MEEDKLLSLIDNNKITPKSKTLNFVMQIIKSNAMLFNESSGLTEGISPHVFDELKSLFEEEFDFLKQYANLYMWLKYFCFNRLALLHLLRTQSNDLNANSKKQYLQKSIGYNSEALRSLEEIIKEYPQEESYAKLYEGYIHRDLFKCYKALGKNKEASLHIAKASKARKDFYFDYRDKYPNETYLIKCFGLEYYLSCAESLEYLKSSEKKSAKKSIYDFIQNLDSKNDRLHNILKQLQENLYAVTLQILPIPKSCLRQAGALRATPLRFSIKSHFQYKNH
jgi:hypothetical protein